MEELYLVMKAINGEEVKIYLERDNQDDVIKNMWKVFVGKDRNFSIENALPTYSFPKETEIEAILLDFGL